MSDKTHDPQYLRTQYANVSKLQSRRALYEYVHPKRDIVAELYQALNLQSTERVLDVGCGDGAALSYLQESGHSGKLIGIDFSEGMLREAQCRKGHQHITLVRASADCLPFASGTFDVLSSFFMIYHMANIEKTLWEWKRIVRPDGLVAIATNSKRSRPKLQRFKARLAQCLNATVPSSFSSRFEMESGRDYLDGFFNTVQTHVLDGQIMLKESLPYIRALDSIRDAIVPPPSDHPWAEAMNMVVSEIEQEIQNSGCFLDPVITGFFVCS